MATLIEDWSDLFKKGTPEEVPYALLKFVRARRTDATHLSECITYLEYYLENEAALTSLTDGKHTRATFIELLTPFMRFVVYYCNKCRDSAFQQLLKEKLAKWQPLFPANSLRPVKPTAKDLQRRARSLPAMPSLPGARSLAPLPQRDVAKVTKILENSRISFKTKRLAAHRAGISLRPDIAAQWHWMQMQLAPPMHPLITQRAFTSTHLSRETMEIFAITMWRKWLTRNLIPKIPCNTLLDFSGPNYHAPEKPPSRFSRVAPIPAVCPCCDVNIAKDAPHAYPPGYRAPIASTATHTHTHSGTTTNINTMTADTHASASAPGDMNAGVDAGQTVTGTETTGNMGFEKPLEEQNSRTKPHPSSRHVASALRAAGLVGLDSKSLKTQTSGLSSDSGSSHSIPEKVAFTVHWPCATHARESGLGLHPSLPTTPSPDPLSSTSLSTSSSTSISSSASVASTSPSAPPPLSSPSGLPPPPTRTESTPHTGNDSIKTTLIPKYPTIMMDLDLVTHSPLGQGPIPHALHTISLALAHHLFGKFPELGEFPNAREIPDNPSPDFDVVGMAFPDFPVSRHKIERVVHKHVHPIPLHQDCINDTIDAPFWVIPGVLNAHPPHIHSLAHIAFNHNTISRNGISVANTGTDAGVRAGVGVTSSSATTATFTSTSASTHTSTPTSTSASVSSPLTDYAHYLDHMLHIYNQHRAHTSPLPPYLNLVIQKLRIQLKQSPSHMAFLKTLSLLRNQDVICVYSRMYLPILLAALIVIGAAPFIPPENVYSIYSGTADVLESEYLPSVTQGITNLASDQPLISGKFVSGGDPGTLDSSPQYYTPGVSANYGKLYFSDFQISEDGQTVKYGTDTKAHLPYQTHALTRAFTLLLQHRGTACNTHIITTLYPRGFVDRLGCVLHVVKGAAGVGKVMRHIINKELIK